MNLANVGDVLGGKFKVERILGIGGMGMVVLATNMDLEQAVAIKFMLPAAMENPEAAARFMREARAAARLTNDHVCKVSDVGKFETGAHYMVMEYMEGQDLGTLLKRRGAQPVATAVDYIMQAAEGMAEAHGHGIVHRDLKPDNLFLANRADGNQIVKILDFGISKAAVTGIATKTGDIMGSPAYMAPEQMQSTKDVDERADIWSLGVILYQLISGRMPFIADTLPALCLAVIHEAPPSLETIRKDLPHGLAEVVMKCLAKSRDERYRNVHQLAQALAPYGKPDAAGAVTRIRSMLQRHRPPTPPPLMMLPSEFSDVAPTLVGSSDSLDIQIEKSPTPLPPAATRTTMGGSSGESMSLPQKRVPRGVIGALLGAIALVGLIIVMVVVKRGHEADAEPAGEPAPPAPPHAQMTAQPQPQPQPQPQIEPIDPTPSLVVEETPPTLDDDQPTHLKRGSADDVKTSRVVAKDPKSPKDLKDPKKDAKDPKDPKDPKKDVKDPKDPKDASAGSGSATPPPDDDNKWGHMLHDGDKQEP